MFDITDPRLTTQSKRDLLNLSNNPEHLADKLLASEQEKHFGCASYWVINRDQLIEMNEWSIEADHRHLNFYTKMLYELNPEYDIILTEQDRIEKGEWDNFLSRKSPYSYQHTCVIAFNGKLGGELPTGIDESDSFIPFVKEKNYPYGKYSANDKHHDAGRMFWSLGVLDAPCHLLKNEDRTYKQTFLFSDTWQQGFYNAWGRHMEKYVNDNPSLKNQLQDAGYDINSLLKIPTKKNKKKRGGFFKGFGDER